MTTRILLATLVAAVSTQAVTARATEAEPRSITVRYTDLNLSAKAGVDALQQRIRQAAKIVCGGDDRRDIERERLYHSCVDLATDKAFAKVELPVR
jgi:UrcA family protein